VNWTTKEVVTIIIAAIGAALGIVNTIFALWQKRVQLRVRVMMALDTAEDYGQDGSGSGRSIGVEVTNLSEFPVTVQSVGFVLLPWPLSVLARVPGFKKVLPRVGSGYLVIKHPRVGGRDVRDVKEDSLPVRVAPRDSIIALANPGEHQKPDFAKAGRAFAVTACGVTRTGPLPKEFRLDGPSSRH
jgi:hypothetical protein